MPPPPRSMTLRVTTRATRWRARSCSPARRRSATQARGDAGARGHGLHLGHASELPAEAGVGPRAGLRHCRRPRVWHRFRPSDGCPVTAAESFHGVSVQHDEGVLRIVIDRPERKNSLDPPAVRRLVETLEVAATDDTLRAVLLTSAGDDFCSGADWVATKRRPPSAAHRQHPAPDPGAGAPSDRAAARAPAAGGVRGAGLGRRSRLPACARCRLHDRRGSSSLLGAVLEARLHTRQRRDVAPAPARRRGACEGAVAARSSISGTDAPRLGDDPPGGAATTSSTARSTVLVNELASSATVALGPHQALHPRGARQQRRRGDGRRGARARALVREPRTSARAWPRSRNGVIPASPVGRGDDAMGYDTIVYEVEDRIATITFNRPDRLNAVSPEMIRELRDAYAAAEADEDVWLDPRHRHRTRVLRGRRRQRDPRRRPRDLRRALPLDVRAVGGAAGGTPPFRTMTKPVLTAVNGLCCGAGLDSVTTGDITIASDRAEFFDPHVSIGLVSGREMVRLARVLPTEHRDAHGAHRQARADERAAGLRARPGLRGRRARPAARAGARDRGASSTATRRWRCAARGSRSARASTCRCTRPRSWPRRSASASCAPTTRRKGRRRSWRSATRSGGAR